MTGAPYSGGTMTHPVGGNDLGQADSPVDAHGLDHLPLALDHPAWADVVPQQGGGWAAEPYLDSRSGA